MHQDERRSSFLLDTLVMIIAASRGFDLGVKGVITLLLSRFLHES